ncbi:hypothetical protein ANCCAN_02952 [Ancylostoma caninum]|uniref:Uncharacterized protein n=1 Tax=Ancylostoma caninum TaxID=29170 RepID=A0A368H5N0_ANCCA|nr:hypothetical protein ANCCAN_02952 [Ancylostoma caninum]
MEDAVHLLPENHILVKYLVRRVKIFGVILVVFTGILIVSGYYSFLRSRSLSSIYVYFSNFKGRSYALCTTLNITLALPIPILSKFLYFEALLYAAVCLVQSGMCTT